MVYNNYRKKYLYKMEGYIMKEFFDYDEIETEFVEQEKIYSESRMDLAMEHGLNWQNTTKEVMLEIAKNHDFIISTREGDKTSAELYTFYHNWSNHAYNKPLKGNLGAKYPDNIMTQKGYIYNHSIVEVKIQKKESNQNAYERWNKWPGIIEKTKGLIQRVYGLSNPVKINGLFLFGDALACDEKIEKIISEAPLNDDTAIIGFDTTQEIVQKHQMNIPNEWGIKIYTIDEAIRVAMEQLRMWNKE